MTHHTSPSYLASFACLVVVDIDLATVGEGQRCAVLAFHVHHHPLWTTEHHPERVASERFLLRLAGSKQSILLRTLLCIQRGESVLFRFERPTASPIGIISLVRTHGDTRHIGRDSGLVGVVGGNLREI